MAGETTGGPVAIGCDVGGTNVKCGLVTAEGELLGRLSRSTGVLEGDEAFARVTDALRELLDSCGADPARVAGIGLDTPGSLLPDGSHVMHYNIDIDLSGLRQALESAFPGATTCVLNDGNAAALGEMWQGAARGARSFCHVVLGTGVGSGIVVDGKVVIGPHGAGGEIGHMCVNPDEPLACTCGKHGCAEQYASATGIVRLYREGCERAGHPLPDDAIGAYEVFQALEAGDACARAAVDEMCRRLGLCLANTSAVVDPELFVIGGGVSGSFGLFGDELRARFRELALPSCKDVPIVAAELGNDAGVFGAAFEALRRASVL
ncbi:MAG: ROK family protein [Atopobiaceae bacterium]|jgi:glucokinase|nr:ROK family protein [Atopobiaceae bacterium]